CRARTSLRLEPRRRYHRGGRWPCCDVAVVSALCRVRLCYRHVRWCRVGRSRQHPWCLLGRFVDRRDPADVDPGAAVPAAKHGNLRRLSADHLPAPAGPVRQAQRADMRTSAQTKRQYWAIGGFAAAILVLMLVLKSAYYQLVLTQVLLWAVM